ncbi:UNVERIFIED_CONTAM: hypothetical protein HDU68_008071 [Siphonaria sp. JEL0065]|nr:hypothetical protein HDU68_008071 [Siphonaria sp. JEL0065]
MIQVALLATVADLLSFSNASQTGLKAVDPKTSKLWHSTTIPSSGITSSNKATNSGGRLLKSVEVYTVFVGQARSPSTINAFYKSIVTSSQFDIAGQYSTIANGILPDQVLLTLLKSGVVTPGPDAYFAIHYGPEYDNSVGQNCQNFCAYHDSLYLNGRTVSLGLMPDCTATVDVCRNWYTASGWNNFAVADGEIGDLCAWQCGQITGGDGNTINVQYLWSNKDNACVLNEGNLSSPSKLTTDPTTIVKYLLGKGIITVEPTAAFQFTMAPNMIRIPMEATVSAFAGATMQLFITVKMSLMPSLIQIPLVVRDYTPEIGDWCNAQCECITGPDGKPINVQKQWSNKENRCILGGTAAPPNLIYGGGRVLSNIKIIPVYVGNNLTRTPLLATSIVSVDVARTGHSCGGQNVAYGSFPDCAATTCASQFTGATPFDSLTCVASANLIEAITDADPYDKSLGFPGGWKAYWSNRTPEIGDTCNAQCGTIKGGDGSILNVQKQWSNKDEGCILGGSVGPGTTTQSKPSATTSTTTTTTVKTTATTTTTTISIPNTLCGAVGSTCNIPNSNFVWTCCSGVCWNNVWTSSGTCAIPSPSTNTTTIKKSTTSTTTTTTTRGATVTTTATASTVLTGQACSSFGSSQCASTVMYYCNDPANGSFKWEVWYTRC